MLVVDDDDLQLRAYQRLLAPDFDVAWARDGGEALLLIDHGVSFDAILSDLQMPRVDGIALHHGLFRSAPRLLSRLLFVSAAPLEDGRYKSFARRIENPILRKPVPPDALIHALRMVIAGVPAFDLIDAPPPSSRPSLSTSSSDAMLI